MHFCRGDSEWSFLNKVQKASMSSQWKASSSVSFTYVRHGIKTQEAEVSTRAPPSPVSRLGRDGLQTHAELQQHDSSLNLKQFVGGNISSKKQSELLWNVEKSQNRSTMNVQPFLCLDLSVVKAVFNILCCIYCRCLKLFTCTWFFTIGSHVPNLLLMNHWSNHFRLIFWLFDGWWRDGEGAMCSHDGSSSVCCWTLKHLLGEHAKIHVTFCL